MDQVTDFFRKLLDTSDWPPRWHCGNWSQFHGWLYIVSDLMIWGAYFTIPLIIIKYITKKTDAGFVRLYFLFAAFILACGATHFLDALTFWVPVYRLTAIVKLATGILSWITVFSLFRVLPDAFSAKTSAELEREIGQRILAEENVLRLNEQLRQMVADKTNEVIASEQKFSSIIEHSQDAISLLDSSYRPLYRNVVSVALMGEINEGDAEYAEWLSRIDEEDKEPLLKAFAKIKISPDVPVNCAIRIRNREGEYLWLEGNITNRLNDKYVKAIVINFKDITERKLIEGQLRKSEKIYREVSANIPGSVITIVDQDRRFVFVEGEALERMGYRKEDMEGRLESDVLSKEALSLVTPNRDKAFSGIMVSTEASLGSVHLLTRFVPLLDENKEVYAVMTISIDISDIKKVQLEVKSLNDSLELKIEDRTRQLERLNKELESFSYSVSHDLRAPLRVINGYAEILVLEQKEGLGEDGRKMLEVIIKNTLRMGRLIDELLNLSRMGRQSLRLQFTDMNAIVREVIDEQILASGTEVKIKVSELLVVPCDGKLMRSVWSNLVSNAIKYSSKQTDPQIDISSHETEDEIVFSVKDNGVGFCMEYSSKLFGVFQRLHKKSEFEGSGVGLALVQRIVSKHNGRVWAEAEENKGATFYFSLPKQIVDDGGV